MFKHEPMFGHLYLPILYKMHYNTTDTNVSQIRKTRRSALGSHEGCLNDNIILYYDQGCPDVGKFGPPPTLTLS